MGVVQPAGNEKLTKEATAYFLKNYQLVNMKGFVEEHDFDMRKKNDGSLLTDESLLDVLYRLNPAWKLIIPFSAKDYVVELFLWFKKDFFLFELQDLILDSFDHRYYASFFEYVRETYGKPQAAQGQYKERYTI